MLVSFVSICLFGCLVLFLFVGVFVCFWYVCLFLLLLLLFTPKHIVQGSIPKEAYFWWAPVSAGCYYRVSANEKMKLEGVRFRFRKKPEYL